MVTVKDFNSVTIDPDIRGGLPVLKGTRVAASQVILELCDTNGPKELADRLNINEVSIKHLLRETALLLHKKHFD